MTGATTRFLARAAGATVLVAAAAAWPASALAGDGALPALALAAAVVLAGAALGRVPRLFLRGAGPDAPVHAAMAGIGARMLSTAALALVVVALEPVARMPFAVSLVGLYLVLLVLEVREAVREVGGALGKAPLPAGGQMGGPGAVTR